MPLKFDPSRKDILTSPERMAWEDPLRVIALLPIRPYHVVADIGCGPGYYTIPLGKHVFDGKVYAVDVQQEMLDAVKKKLEEIHLTNVELVLSQETDIPIPKESLDGVLIAYVLQETEDRLAFLQEVVTLLKRGGWAAILEWYKKDTGVGPPLEQRLNPEEVAELGKKGGFRFIEQRDLNGRQYMVLLRK